MNLKTKKWLSLICVIGLLMSSIVLSMPQIAKAKDYTSLGCVSWVKDRAMEKLGISLPPTGLNEFGLYGASAYWTNLSGYSKGSAPASNSLAVWKFNNGTDGANGKYGHVAFVEEVNGDQVTVTEGGCAGYSYAGHTGVIQRTQSSSKMATLGGCSSFLGYIYLSGNGGNNPQAHLDEIKDCGGKIFVRGWAFDKDSPSESLAVHIYIGDEGHPIVANKESTDVNNAYGISGNHRFEEYIDTSKRGAQTVYFHAIINVGGGSNEMWDKRDITISNPAPTPVPTSAPAPTVAPTSNPNPTVQPTINPVGSSGPFSNTSAIAKDFTITEDICTQEDNAIFYIEYKHNKSYTYSGCGWTLYDENNTVLTSYTYSKNSTSKTLEGTFNIKELKNYTLQKGKKYKIQAYCVFDSIKIFTNVIEFSAVKKELVFSSNKVSELGSTNAVIMADCSNISKQTVPSYSFYLYDSSGNLIKQQLFNSPVNYQFIEYTFDINKHIGYTLIQNTTYQYVIGVTLNGIEYKTTIQKFTTKNGGETSTPAPTIVPPSTTDPGSSSSVVPKPPSFKLKGIKSGFKITITKKTGMDWYEIEYSTKKNMRSAETTTIFQDGGSTKKITWLKRKKKYYVRVRSYNGRYGSWGSKRIVNTK